MTKSSFSKYLESKTAKWPRRYVRYIFGSAGFFAGAKLFAFIMEEFYCIKILGGARKKLILEYRAKQFFNAGKPFGKWLEVRLPKSTEEAEKLLPYFRKAYLIARKTN